VNVGKVERSKAYNYVSKSGPLLVQQHQPFSGNCHDQIFQAMTVEEGVLFSKPVLDREFDGMVRCKLKTLESFFLSLPNPIKCEGTSRG
jgi:hypothetical protein